MMVYYKPNRALRSTDTGQLVGPRPLGEMAPLGAISPKGLSRVKWHLIKNPFIFLLLTINLVLLLILCYTNTFDFDFDN